MLKLFELSVLKTGELPSSNGHCSARGLAKIASMMTNKGTIDGIEILSEETLTQLHDGYEEPEIVYPHIYQVHFSQGGVYYFTPDESSRVSSENRKGYFGRLGAGGSVFQWYLE